MNDLINRQDAIYIIKQYFQKNYVVDGEWYADELIRELSDLPSAEKTGKWTIEDVHSATYKYCCSECKAHHRARYDFCPTCGAKMEVYDG